MTGVYDDTVEACDVCGSVLGDCRYTLCRQIEVTEDEGHRYITDVMDSEVVSQVCLECGEGVALELLEKRGLQCVKVGPIPLPTLCACCHGVIVDQREPHVVYTLEATSLDAPDADGVIACDSAALYLAHLCQRCGAADGVRRMREVGA